MTLVTVVAVERLTPRMTRVTFTGPGLSEVDSWPDQQLKLMFPPPGRPLVLPAVPEGDAMRWYQAFQAIPAPDRPTMRSFTARSLRDGRLVVDFVLHDHGGPAAQWAQRASPGDTLGRYGPSPEYARPLNLAADWVLLAGDETALPAVGSLLPLPGATVLVEVANEAEEQDLPGVRWLPRNDAPHGACLTEAVAELAIPRGDTFAWLAGEATMVRTLRRALVARGIPKKNIDFAGYWRATLTQDDAPTAEDMAEAQERLTDLEATKSPE
jgi:NADPH-dependent ferric siderophore reductase